MPALPDTTRSHPTPRVGDVKVALLQRAAGQVPGRTFVKRILVLMTALLAITVGATACSSDSDDTSTTSTTAKILAFSDAATPVAVVPGQEFSISLETIAGTGFKWTITGQPDAELVTVVTAQGTVKASDGDSDAVGTAGSTVFDFTAKASGTTEITFTSARPTDPADSPTSETFTINVS